MANARPLKARLAVSGMVLALAVVLCGGPGMKAIAAEATRVEHRDTVVSRHQIIRVTLEYDKDVPEYLANPPLAQHGNEPVVVWISVISDGTPSVLGKYLYPLSAVSFAQTPSVLALRKIDEHKTGVPGLIVDVPGFQIVGDNLWFVMQRKNHFQLYRFALPGDNALARRVESTASLPLDDVPVGKAPEQSLDATARFIAADDRLYVYLDTHYGQNLYVVSRDLAGIGRFSLAGSEHPDGPQPPSAGVAKPDDGKAMLEKILARPAPRTVRINCPLEQARFLGSFRLDHAAPDTFAYQCGEGVVLASGGDTHGKGPNLDYYAPVTGRRP